MNAFRGVHEFLASTGGTSPVLSGESSLFTRDQWGKPLIPADARSVYSFGLLIRKSEETLLRLFSQGLLSGTTHTCLGQELCQMSVVRALADPGDVVLSNHRNHGHFLTYSGAFVGLLAEIMGREAGICAGIGGSQHLAHRHFHSNGVQAGMTAIGVGHALAIQRRNEQAIVAVVVGDGTLGEGLLYESLNLASIWKLPILFVVENNGIAQTTPTKDTIGGSIEARGAAFGLKTWRLDDSSPDFLTGVEKVVSEVRSSRKPGYLVIDTKRLGPHSKGDDLRSSAEMDEIRARDPLTNLGKTLPAKEREKIDAATTDFIEAAHQAALNSPESRFREVPKHIFAAPRNVLAATKSDPAQQANVRGALNSTLHKLLSASPEVLLLGEDLHDPYGGAFKVTSGLNTAFPGRVISTPISEAGIVGTGIGLALAGFRPVVEIMFADFVTLAMDQIFNHAVKFPGMFEDAHVPLVIRTPSGGRRGYGPTHSQSPETLVTAIPGLTVVFGSNRHDIGGLLRNAVLEWPYPTVFFEHKLLYGQTVDMSGYETLSADASQPVEELFPTLTNGTGHPDVTFVCYGSAVGTVEAVAEKLAREELATEIVIPSLLSPLPQSLVGLLLERDRVIVFEEGQSQFGFSAELGATLAESGFRGRFLRVGPPPIPIPAARSLEADVLPGEVALLERVTHSLLAELARQS
jgi:2-oxoisovalerate dehydrogenase E1 component